LACRGKHFCSACQCTLRPAPGTNIYSAVQVEILRAYQESPYVDADAFVAALQGTDYAHADLRYYHEVIRTWAESKDARNANWLPMMCNWMLRETPKTTNSKLPLPPCYPRPPMYTLPTTPATATKTTPTSEQLLINTLTQNTVISLARGQITGLA
jgi:hypothetical protein